MLTVPFFFASSDFFRLMTRDRFSPQLQLSLLFSLVLPTSLGPYTLVLRYGYLGALVPCFHAPRFDEQARVLVIPVRFCAPEICLGDITYSDFLTCLLGKKSLFSPATPGLVIRIISFLALV